jgi:uncharacterized membrane protein
MTVFWTPPKAAPSRAASRLSPSASRVRTHDLRQVRLTPGVAWGLAALAAVALALPAFAGKVSIAAPEAAETPCERCKVQMVFATKMRDLGAEIEFVELRDGLGVFYTNADARLVPKIQTATEWARNELVRVSNQPLDHLHLCQYCKASRPIYSRINREVVRTERGAFFIMRSEDADAVRALHEMRLKAEQGRTNSRTSPAPSR